MAFIDKAGACAVAPGDGRGVWLAVMALVWIGCRRRVRGLACALVLFGASVPAHAQDCYQVEGVTCCEEVFITWCDYPAGYPAPTPTPAALVGDCDGSGEVDVADLVTAVKTVLAYCPPSLCNQTPETDGHTCPSVISCPLPPFVVPPQPIECLTVAVNNAMTEECLTRGGTVESGRVVCH